MTFVPQPFELIADDLLTALTGGVTREEHRFIGADEAYSVASSDVIPESVTIAGQIGEAFVRFERDRDYGLDRTTGGIRWRTGSGARQPNPNSRFYVSYYRSEGTRRLTDRNPGSVTFLLAQAFAREIAVIQQQLAGVYRSGFLDLAEGDALDHVAALLGMVRKDARFATGEVLFFRETPAPGDITIPPGTLVSTPTGEVFETEERRTLRRGQMAIGSSIRARVEGSLGRVEARTITVVNRPIFGVDGVVNEEGTFFATDRESDEAFRRRVRGTLERAGRSSLEAIRLALLEQVPGLNETNVRVTERTDVPGLVEIQFGVGNEVDASFVRRAEAAIMSARAAGIRVTHNLGRSSASRTEDGPVVVREGARPPVRLDPEVLALNANGVVDLQVAVLVRLVDPALTPQQKETIQSELRARVNGYFDQLAMGSDVIHAKVLAGVVEHGAVVDAIVRIGPAGSAPPTFEQNVATEGRKARVAGNAVTVSLMAEPVDIDVLVLLDPRSPAAGTPHEAAVRDALAGLTTAPPASVPRSAVEGAVTAALGTVTPALVLPSESFIRLNARYEDTGRVLLDADVIALEEHHVSRWRNVAFQGAEN